MASAPYLGPLDLLTESSSRRAALMVCSYGHTTLLMVRLREDRVLWSALSVLGRLTTPGRASFASVQSKDRGRGQREFEREMLYFLIYLHLRLCELRENTSFFSKLFYQSRIGITL